MPEWPENQALAKWINDQKWSSLTCLSTPFDSKQKWNLTNVLSKGKYVFFNVVQKDCKDQECKHEKCKNQEYKKEGMFVLHFMLYGLWVTVEKESSPLPSELTSIALLKFDDSTFVHIAHPKNAKFALPTFKFETKSKKSKNHQIDEFWIKNKLAVSFENSTEKEWSSLLSNSSANISNKLVNQKLKISGIGSWMAKQIMELPTEHKKCDFIKNWMNRYSQLVYHQIKQTKGRILTKAHWYNSIRHEFLVACKIQDVANDCFNQRLLPYYPNVKKTILSEMISQKFKQEDSRKIKIAFFTWLKSKEEKETKEKETKEEKEKEPSKKEWKSFGFDTESVFFKNFLNVFQMSEKDLLQNDKWETLPGIGIWTIKTVYLKTRTKNWKQTWTNEDPDLQKHINTLFRNGLPVINPEWFWSDSNQLGVVSLFLRRLSSNITIGNLFHFNPFQHLIHH
jgi:hypothetical protein